MLKRFHELINNTPEKNGVKSLLITLCNLYAAWSISKHICSLYQGDSLSAGKERGLFQTYCFISAVVLYTVLVLLVLLHSTPIYGLIPRPRNKANSHTHSCLRALSFAKGRSLHGRLHATILSKIWVHSLFIAMPIM